MSVNEYDETSYERLFTYGIYEFFYKKKRKETVAVKIKIKILFIFSFFQRSIIA